VKNIENISPTLTTPSLSIGKGAGVFGFGEGCRGGDVEKVWNFNEVLIFGLYNSSRSNKILLYSNPLFLCKIFFEMEIV